MKFLWIPLLFSAAIISSACSNNPQNENNQPNNQIETNEKTNVVTEMIAPVRLNNQWMYINQAGEQLYDSAFFTHAGEFDNGLTCVSTDGTRTYGSDAVYGALYNAMDMEGNIIEKIKSDLPFVFSEGVAITSWGNEKNLVDENGKVLRTEKIQAHGNATDGLILVMYPDYKLEYWDTQGNTVLTFTDVGAMGNFSEGLTYFKTDGIFGYMDKKGQVAKDRSYLFASLFEDGVARVQKEDGWYIIDKNFKELTGPYLSITGYSEGAFLVETEKGWSYFDKNGTQIIPDFYKAIDPFSEGKAVVLLKSGGIAMIDKQGKAIKTDAKMIFPLKNGLAIAEKDGKMGFVDSNGKWVIEAKYERVADFYKLK